LLTPVIEKIILSCVIYFIIFVDTNIKKIFLC
jgi:hypothetical protein